MDKKEAQTARKHLKVFLGIADLDYEGDREIIEDMYMVLVDHAMRLSEVKVSEN